MEAICRSVRRAISGCKSMKYFAIGQIILAFIVAIVRKIVSLHILLAGLLMPAEGDSRLNINTFMGLGDGPRGCGKVIENNKKQQ